MRFSSATQPVYRYIVEGQRKRTKAFVACGKWLEQNNVGT
jgi:hypothetical protein